MYLPQKYLTGIEDISPVFTCFAVAMYLFLDRFVIIHSKIIGIIIGFISKRTFYIFLIHVNVINAIDRFNYVTINNVLLNYCIKTLLVFAVSLILSWLLDMIYKMVKTGVNKLGRGIKCRFHVS